jgi:UDP-N-acetylglucosamine 2-epimerase
MAAALRSLGIEFEEIDVDADPRLDERYGETVPVLDVSDLKLIQLPSLRAADKYFKVLLNEQGVQADDSWKEDRRRRLLDLYGQLRPDVVVIQGDNTTVLAVSLAAHYLGIPVAHLDAGLRANNLKLPFPEQLNRKLAAVVSDLHFAPTPAARENLLREGVPNGHIVIAGNTIVDAIRLTPSRPTFDDAKLNAVPWTKRRVVLVTMHRRESIGAPLENVCQALIELVAMHADLQVIMPVHPNPQVRHTVIDKLGALFRIELVDPMSYGDMTEAMRRSEFVMTDSGGVQEECAAIVKPVLILRRSTDRPEVIESGVGRLVGTDTQQVVAAAAPQPEYFNQGNPANRPFSLAVRAGDYVHLAGQMGTDEKGLVPGGFEAQSRRAMDNIASILKGMNLSTDHLVKCTVMLADITQWGVFNEIYKTHFGAPYPARSALGASGLALGAQVEVECVAHKRAK